MNEMKRVARQECQSKILVIGNICSGKTRLIDDIVTKGWVGAMPVVSIDEMRSQHGDGTISGEYLAWYYFLKTCSQPCPQVIEFSGGGAHKHAVLLALLEAGLPVKVILLDVPLEICEKRVSEKQWKVPYPSWGKRTEEILDNLAKELREDYVSGIWSNHEKFQCFRVQTDDGKNWIYNANFPSLENYLTGGK
ncbi:MAG: hypothetical protein ACTSU5_02845 [Promethearchaeota archaeon]